MTKKIETYNKFVDYYDEIIRGNGYDVDSEIFFVNELIENNYKIHLSPLLENRIEILEFACGTGTIARELEKKGYSVFGVDLSKQMIDKCNDKNKFIIGDMTTINLEKEFDVVLCNFNSICHLNSWEDWQKFFKNAYKHLKKGGILIFDILTIFEFENIASDFRGFFNVKGDTICLEMFKDEQYYKWLIKMFINSGKNNFELIEEEIKEISFPISKINKKLEDIGFKLKHLEDFHFGEVNDESERVYFVVQK